jgi:hypothetical protein
MYDLWTRSLNNFGVFHNHFLASEELKQNWFAYFSWSFCEAMVQAIVVAPVGAPNKVGLSV